MTGWQTTAMSKMYLASFTGSDAVVHTCRLVAAYLTVAEWIRNRTVRHCRSSTTYNKAFIDIRLRPAVEIRHTVRSGTVCLG